MKIKYLQKYQGKETWYYSLNSDQMMVLNSERIYPILEMQKWFKEYTPNVYWKPEFPNGIDEMNGDLTNQWPITVYFYSKDDVTLFALRWL